MMGVPPQLQVCGGAAALQVDPGAQCVELKSFVSDEMLVFGRTTFFFLSYKGFELESLVL